MTTFVSSTIFRGGDDPRMNWRTLTAIISDHAISIYQVVAFKFTSDHRFLCHDALQGISARVVQVLSDGMRSRVLDVFEPFE